MQKLPGIVLQLVKTVLKLEAISSSEKTMLLIQLMKEQCNANDAIREKTLI